MSEEMNNNGMTMRYPATRWQDALPTGSGVVGALVYGNILNDTITLKGFPLKETQTLNITLLQPILPVQLTKDWIWVNRPVLSFMSVPTPKLDSSGQGQFPGQFPGGSPSFNDIQNNVSTDRKFEFGDVIYVAPNDPHQFRNPDDATEPFGFLCIVNAERDRPQSVDCLGACFICE